MLVFRLDLFGSSSTWSMYIKKPWISSLPVVDYYVCRYYEDQAFYLFIKYNQASNNYVEQTGWMMIGQPQQIFQNKFLSIILRVMMN